MGVFRTSRSDHKKDKALRPILSRSAFDRFDERILGLGDINKSAEPVDAICIVYDLEGFTAFSRQVDPHLAVPHFMSRFLSWLFAELKRRYFREEVEGGVKLYARLPFFAKFMGDGVMFLWDTKDLPRGSLTNIPMIANIISESYKRDFAPQMSREFSDVPRKLRVGVARGRVFAVGGGSDYVGPCINIASRLQKIGSTIRFCMAKRGWSADEVIVDENNREIFVLKSVPIRGIGETELVYIERKEYDQLPVDEKVLFRDP